MSRRGVAILGDRRILGQRGDAASPGDLYVLAIEELAELKAWVLPIEVGPTRVVAPALAAEVGAVFLTCLHPKHIRIVSAMIDAPVVSDLDTMAIAVTAALLTTLSRAGKPLQDSRVVIAGAKTMPILFPLLQAAGVRDVAAWNPADAQAFPLRHLSAGADVVIDLLAGTASFAVHADTPVITTQDGGSLLALPGLLRALTWQPGASPSVELYLACALALVMATPPSQRLPSRPSRSLAHFVGDAAIEVLRRQSRDRPHGPELS